MPSALMRLGTRAHTRAHTDTWTHVRTHTRTRTQRSRTLWPVARSQVMAWVEHIVVSLEVSWLNTTSRTG